MVERRVIPRVLWTAVCWIVLAGSAIAQEFPTKPIKIICAFGVGSAVDTFARVIAQNLSEQMKATVIVENRPGANGMIGVEAGAKAPPDGYTLVIGSNSTHAANASLFSSLPYDPERDFEPVAFLASLPSLMVANPSVPFRTLPGLIAYARANPGKLSYGTANSTALIIGESIKSLAGIDMVAVRYKSSPPALNDVIAGLLPLMMVDVSSVTSHLKSGRLIALATAFTTPHPLVPNVPPISATLPGFDISAWIGLFAPAGTPAAVVDKLASEVQRSLQNPSARTLLQQRAFELRAMTRAEFGAFVGTERERWAKWVKDLGIKLQ